MAKTELEDAGLETDGMAASTSKLQEQIKALSGGFDILENDGKTFKSTYDIVLGIAERYGSMSDLSQAALLELLAGKRNSNALAAAMNNAEGIKKTYELALDSDGSAMKEYDKYLTSVEAKQKRMQATFQSFSVSTLSSEVMGTGYDVVSGFLETLQSISDLLGSFPTLAAAAGAAMSLMFKDSGISIEYAPLREIPSAA